MCLAIEINTKSKIARKDHTVYKLLTPFRRSFFSPMSVKYYANFVYKTNIEVSPTGIYFTDAERRYWRNKRKTTDVKFIKQGFHSIKHLEQGKRLEDERVILYQCTIPKGSEYYESPLGFLVSNQIIVHDEVRYEGTDE